MRSYYFILLLATLGASPAWAELVVVAHPSVKIASIRQADLGRLFTGQAKTLPDGSEAVALHVVGDRRDQFYQQMLGKTPVQMERYWARMIFTGKAQPLRELSARELKGTLAETPGAISYMDADQVGGGLRIIRVEK